MRIKRSVPVFLAAVLFTLIPVSTFAQEDQVADVEKALNDQTAAWNRGDIDSFVSYYKNSPDTDTIVGKKTLRGWQAIFEVYKRNYATKEARGMMDLPELHVRMLGSKYALATGSFHIARSGGEVSGYFSVVCEKTSRGWKVIHDHNNYT